MALVIAAVIGIGLNKLLATNSWPILIAQALLIFMVYLLFMIWTGFDAEERQHFILLIKKIFRRA